jgi:hypothetical protein
MKNAIPNTKFVCIALLLGSLHATLARAGFYGNEIRLEQVYPDLNSIPLTFSPVLAGPGVEFSQLATDYDWDVGDAEIEIVRNCNINLCDLNYTPSAFNGFKLSGSSRELQRIVGVSLISFSGFTNFDPSRLTFDDRAIYISLGGLSSDSIHTAVRMSVSFEPSPVPLPGTLGLISMGLASIFGIGRRRKHFE